MKKQRKLLLIALLLLLISFGIVVAQTSTNFNSLRFVMLSGGTSDSDNYNVTSVIGQPTTGDSSSSSFKATGGFLFPIQSSNPDSAQGRKIYLPLILR
ncbi:MAG: hypothetical protein DWQ04_07215 [Chloroflexi bacterium]|nr:MAG: hypothetical protein DWQ04_07215 [Chloroflexota bacterium]